VRSASLAAILDTHRSARLTTAERTAVDTHLLACESCAAAWHAQGELLALRLPPVPATLLDRALRAARTQPSSTPRRLRTPIVVASVLLAGAALAGLAVVSLTDPPSDDTAAASTSATPAPATEDPATTEPVPLQPTAAAATQPSDDSTSVELVETALSVIPLVRYNPDYPPSAMEQRLEGHVQVRFDITAAGVVENLTVVESSDAVFEESATRAVSRWRYLPRIAAGKRVGSSGIHTRLSFALGGDRPPPDPERERAQLEAMRQYAAFTSDLEIALNRLATDNLRGAELQLDEMQALHGSHYPDLWHFYGYLHTVQGNYGRAIDAYETSVATFARVGQSASGPWVPLANLYFARHQYDMALKTLVAYRERIAEVQARNSVRLPARPLEAEAQRLIEQLRALGITDETLR
jgi:TonB family protein